MVLSLLLANIPQLNIATEERANTLEKAFLWPKVSAKSNDAAVTLNKATKLDDFFF